jgi:enoyl-[acyl-carrier protein] reductase III
MGDLDGKRALVTGAARGIGSAIVRELASAGATVCVHYRESRDAAETLAREIDGSAIQANLVNPHEIRRLATDAGAIDILVHNAAIGSFKKTLDVRPNQFDLSMSVNARALLLLAQELVSGMRPGSRIIAISSLGGARVFPSYGAIGVSKAALESLVRYLGAELAPRGIIVNGISAGVIDSPTVRNHPQSDEVLRTAASRTPSGSLVTAQDVARLVHALCGAAFEGVVGQTIVLDGGASLLA